MEEWQYPEYRTVRSILLHYHQFIIYHCLLRSFTINIINSNTLVNVAKVPKSWWNKSNGQPLGNKQTTLASENFIAWNLSVKIVLNFLNEDFLFKFPVLFFQSMTKLRWGALLHCSVTMRETNWLFHQPRSVPKASHFWQKHRKNCKCCPVSL